MHNLFNVRISSCSEDQRKSYRRWTFLATDEKKFKGGIRKGGRSQISLVLAIADFEFKRNFFSAKMLVAGGLFLFVILASTAGLTQLSGFLFSLDQDYSIYLKRGPVAPELHEAFEENGEPLEEADWLTTTNAQRDNTTIREWYVGNGSGTDRYRIVDTGNGLSVFDEEERGLNLFMGKKALLRLDTPDSVLSTVSPIIAYVMALMTVVFGFSTVTSELKSGTIDLLVTKPMKTTNIIGAKFLGITGALSVPVTLSLPLCVLIIRYRFGVIPSLWGTLAFWVFTVIFIATFVLLSLIFATISRSTATSVTLGITLFLIYTFFWSILTYSVQYLLGCDIGKVSNPRNLAITDTLGLLNPVINYQNSVALVFDSRNVHGIPSWLPSLALLAMMVGLFFLVRALFSRRIRKQDY